MLVLDYPRTMGADDFSLLISPFHTGHLGFRPDTEVNLQLLKAPRSSTAYCELVVSTFDRAPTGTAILTAVMRDEVGVVERLVSSIAELGVNIDAEESASIAHLNRHAVTLVLDLAALAETPSRLSDSVAQGVYRDYADFVPLHDARCRLIFESVIRHCADVLAIRSGGLVPTLDINMLLLDGDPDARTAKSTLVAQPKQKVRLPLPDEICDGIRDAQRPKPEREVDYLFLSDTDDRSLRVFFLPKPTADSVYHVALHHRNRPGGLGVLLSLTARANFNILTSLIRSGEEPEENVWEAVLQYRGDDLDRPPRPANEDDEPDWFSERALPWIRDKLANAITNPGFVASFDISVSRPTYPRPTNTPTHSLPLIEGAHPPAEPVDFREVDHSEQIKERRAQISRLPEHEQEIRLAVLDQVERQRDLARIYLAYTPDGRPHAELLESRLKEHYTVVSREVARPDMAALHDRAREVAACDFFICLWHHDKYLAQGPGAFGGSPWAHFQLGLAVASAKPLLVVRSADADPAIWPGELAGPSHVFYSDLEFVTVTLDEIDQYCRENFVVAVDA